VDPEIEELKDMVHRSLALAEDTNRVVHGMRSIMAWGRFFRLLWWVVVILGAIALYHYYLQPYIKNLEQLYQHTQSQTLQVQNFGTQLSDFIKNHFIPQTPTSSQVGSQ